MPRGGARPGAGRPARAKVVLGSFDDPKLLLEAVLRSDACDPALRVRAATTLLQYELAVEKFRAQLFCEEEIGGPRWPPNPAVGVAKTS